MLGPSYAVLRLNIRIDHPSIAHRDAAFLGRPDAPKADFVIHELDELPAIIRKVNGQLPHIKE